MRIWKWTLKMVDNQVVNMPIGAKVLTVQMQNGEPQVWALCDEANPTEPRQIAIYGTGNPLPLEPGEYIATFQMHDGALVWHAFEIKE